MSARNVRGASYFSKLFLPARARRQLGALHNAGAAPRGFALSAAAV